MKPIFPFLLYLVCWGTFTSAQSTRPGTTTPKKVIKAKPVPAATQPPMSSGAPVQMRQTATERYINGGNRNPTSSTTTTTENSPFVGGIHPAQNASQPFNNGTSVTNVNQAPTGVVVRGSNDTTFNVNTINNGDALSNSGAVDRSGQAQFGQTNWGDSRSTVGEGQWTVPPPITASFSKEFPAANAATWSRNNVDTSMYSAHYKVGTTWVTTNYNAAGQRLDMRTEIPLLQPPRPVSVYLAKQPANFHVVTINKLQVQGRPDAYEILTQNGKTIYLDTDGMEINF